LFWWESRLVWEPLQALMPQPDCQAPLLQLTRLTLIPSPDRQAPLLPPARQVLMPLLDYQAPLPSQSIRFPRLSR
jgi:hypothetical protein